VRPPLRAFLGFLLLGFAAGAPAMAQNASERTPPPPVLNDVDAPDGDDVWDNAQQSLAAATNEPDALRALFTVVNLQRRRGDYSEGMAGARDGLARARALGDVALQIDFLYLLARLHWNLSDFPASLERHLEELKLAESLGDASRLARTHGGLGLTYLRSGRDDDALHHFERGLDYARQANDGRMRASLLNSLGNYHLGRREYERAIAIHTEALQLREGFGNRRAIADSLTNLGLAADGLGQTDKALAYLQRALSTFETLRYRRYIANSHRRLGMVLRHAGRLDEALAHLQSALRIADSLRSAEVLAEIHRELALTHEARGDFAAALASERQLAAANDQLQRDEDRRRLDELRARYRDEQRELQITLLRRDQDLKNAELQQRRSQNLALFAGLVLGVTVLGAVIVVQLVRLRAERKMRAATERARAQAEQAEALKSRLLQMASHDLKVPLTALNATAALIARTPNDEPTVRRLAAGIQADTARMRSLVRDFLEASAIEAGNLQLHSTPLDLAELVRHAVESLQPVAAQKEQRLSLVRPASPVPAVLADAERMRQVFDNLIGNGLKFSPLRGEVVVALGDSGAWAFVEVRDSGPGLGPSDFAKIFAPYQRLSAKPTGEGEDSTGLGLFIARELLTLQGGRLEVQSQPGKGAVFRVLLPVAAR
jgi:signal transduction histidine kinase